MAGPFLFPDQAIKTASALTLQFIMLKYPESSQRKVQWLYEANVIIFLSKQIFLIRIGLAGAW